MSKNMGYGICGMKNSFSGKALLDNWVEDRFGTEIVAQGDRLGEKFYTTTTMATHFDPKDMPVHPNILKVKLESVRDLKARNKEGMPYNILFTNEKSLVGIGNPYQSSLQRFQAAGAGANFALPERQLTNIRAKNIRREKALVDKPRSVYHDANSRHDKVPDIPAMAEGPLQELPVFKRVSLISGMGRH